MSLRSALRRIHDRSPVSVQTTMRMAYGRVPDRWKLGDEFQRYCRELMHNDSRTGKELDDLQFAKLRLMIDHCYQNVPFYRKRFDRTGFKPAHFKKLNDLKRIPILTRQDLREHFDELKANNAASFSPEECYSGGSTGEPVKFLLDRKAIALEKACVRRHWLRSGYKPGEPCANLRGLRLSVKQGKFWVVDKGDNCIYLSSYHLTSETVTEFVKAFNNFRPALFNTYASNACLMATLVQEEGIEVHSPRSIVCASESLYPYQRERIESVFKTKVWDWYGLTELVGNASQCELQDGYHVSIEQGYFEVIGENGLPASPGESGEIIATGLHNFSMPLLRYQTGDLAEATTEPCRCGRRSHTVKSIRGRINEFVETPSGVRLTATALNVHGDTWENVTQFQYVQKSATRVHLRIVKGAAYTEANERRILRQMAERLGNEIRVGIEYVPEIAKSARGKSPLIVKEREDRPAEPAAVTFATKDKGQG